LSFTPKEAVSILSQKFLLQEGIAGVSHGSNVLKVYVESPEVAEKVPKSLMDFPVKVIVSGKFKALSLLQGTLPEAKSGKTIVGLEASRTAKWRPCPGGVSVAHYLVTAGTLATRVYDVATGRKLFLSNNHVLAATNRGRSGDPILQPGPYDKGKLPDDQLGVLERFIELKPPPDTNLIDAACLPEGEIIYNSFLPINVEQAEPKELYGLGEGTEVIKKHVREYEGDIIEITPMFLFPFRLTPDHPVLVCRNDRFFWRFEWVRAGELRSGYSPHATDAKRDYLVLPIPKGEENVTINLRKYFRKSRHINSVPYEVSFKDIAWLLGLYVADGYANTRSGHITFCLTPGDRDGEEKINEYAKILNLKTFYKRRVGGENQITIGSTPLARFLREEFGGGRGNEKKIPSWVFKADKFAIKMFLDGLIYGDGWVGYGKGGRIISITTSSRTLAYQIPLLLAKLGFICSIHENKQGIERINIGKRFITRKKIAYDIRVTGERAEMYLEGRFSNVTDYILVPIRSISRRHYKGAVYNFTTKSGIYSIPFIVHNCGSPLREEDLSDEILDIGVVSGWDDPVVGMKVCKSGRTSGYTESTITDVNASIKVYYGEEYYVFEDQIITGHMMDPGDSGSLLVNTATKRAVGLGFAGSDTLSCANKISNVLSMLNISLSPTGAIVPPSPVTVPFQLAFIPVLFGAFISTYSMQY